MAYLTVSELAKMFSEIAQKTPDMVVLIPSGNYEDPLYGMIDTDLLFEYVEIAEEEDEFQNPVYVRGQHGEANALILSTYSRLL